MKFADQVLWQVLERKWQPGFDALEGSGIFLYRIIFWPITVTA